MSQEQKKSPKKHRLGKVLGIAVVVLVVIVIGVLLSLNWIVAGAVRAVGGEATGTTVAVKSLNLSLWGGSLSIDGLTVGNPEGFEVPDALGFSELKVELDIASLTSDKIIVNLVEINNLTVDYELRLGGSNLTDIQNNIETFVSKFASKDAAAPETEKPAKQVVIRKLIVRDGNLTLASKTLGQQIDIPLPTIEMNDLGEGMAYPEMISEFFRELMTNLASVISSANLPDIDLSGFSSDINKALSDSLNTVGESLKGVGESVQKGLGDLGSLLDGSKK